MWSFLVAALAAAASVSPAPAPAAPSLADLPRGDPPAVGYVVDGVWHDPSGRRVRLPERHGISAVTPYDGGFLVADTRFFEGSVGLAQVDARGQTVQSWSSSGIAAVADDDRVAWTSFVAPESGLTGPSLVHVDACAFPWPGGRHGFFSAAGFVGDDVVVTDPLGTHLLGLDGTRTRVRGVGFASDATDDRVAGQVGRRSGVVDVATGRVLWRSRLDGLTFSPDGRRVAGVARDRVVVRRSSDGQVLWEQGFRGYAGPLAWERGRVLSVVAQRDRAAVLRFGPDGVERATRVREHRFDRPAFVLTTR